MKKITIIGAGIGGLTLALALKRKDFNVEIFENAPEFKAMGSGINLAINAMQVFKKLGIYNQLREASHPVSSMNLRTKDLGYLSRSNLQSFIDNLGAQSVAIHRAKLHSILIQQLEDVSIHLGKRLKRLQQTEEKTTLHFEDGTSHESEIVIGADGLHSAVRQSIFPDSKLRDAQQFCWRGISEAPPQTAYRNQLNEIWGKGKRFGFVPIGNSETYWYALINKADGTPDRKQNLVDTFYDFHPTVKELLLSTPNERLIAGEIWDLAPLPKWHQGSVCLIGDAAHATTPNLGQGACQAIESAMVLSLCLGKEKNHQEAFRKYESIRKEKALHVINTSWTLGKLAQTTDPLTTLIRNTLLKITPNFLVQKQNAKVLELDYQL